MPTKFIFSTFQFIFLSFETLLFVSTKQTLPYNLASKFTAFFFEMDSSRPQLVVKTINIKKFYFDINHNIYELNTLSTGGMTGLAPLWIP